jgi:hypothetical protein
MAIKKKATKPAVANDTAEEAAEPTTIWTSAHFAKGLARKAKLIHVKSLNIDVYCKPISGRSMQVLRKFHAAVKGAQAGDEGADIFGQMEELTKILSVSFCNPDSSPLASADDWLDADFELMMELITASITPSKAAKNA